MELFYNFYGWNQKLFVWLNHTLNSLHLAYPLSYLSFFFQFYLVCSILLASVLFIHFNLRLIKNSELRYKRFSYLQALYTKIGLNIFTFGFIYGLLKYSIALPRPFCSLPSDLFITILDISNIICGASFPSAHFGLALLISIGIWRYLSSTGKFFCISVTLLTGLSRIALAMHYPADLLYSIPVTFFSIYSCELIYLHTQKLITKIMNYLYLKLYS
jgi:membrane-associated phospholipid phosphatase